MILGNTGMPTNIIIYHLGESIDKQIHITGIFFLHVKPFLIRAIDNYYEKWGNVVRGGESPNTVPLLLLTIKQLQLMVDIIYKFIPVVINYKSIFISWQRL